MSPPPYRIAVNERITASEVLLIDADGAKVGVLSTIDALARARAKNLDLVVFNPKSSPPVAKILDWARYRRAQHVNDHRRDPPDEPA